MNEPSAARQFVGGMMMVIGGLLGGLSGLCTLGFQVGFLYDALQGGAARTGGGDFTLPTFLPLLFGVVPILVGVGLFFWGRWLRRPPPVE